MNERNAMPVSAWWDSAVVLKPALEQHSGLPNRIKGLPLSISFQSLALNDFHH
jgi:hypothetical protein